MDPEQFKELLASIQASQAAMLTNIAEQLQPQRSQQTNIASITPYKTSNHGKKNLHAIRKLL